MRNPMKTRPRVFAGKTTFRRQHGQATIEYVLLLGIAAGIGVTFMTTFPSILAKGILTFNVTLETELVSAGFAEAADGWEN